jgi:TonB family protein
MTGRDRFFLLALVLTGMMAAAKDSAPSAQQLIDAAHAVSDLSKLGPYVLTGLVVVNPGDKNARKGHVTVYRDGDRTRVDLEIDGQEDSGLTLGANSYFDPRPGLLAMTRIGRLDRSWDPGAESEAPRWIQAKSSFGPVKPSKAAGVQLWCMDKNTGPLKTRFCFDAASGVLLSTDTQSVIRKEFLEFTSAGAVMFPRKIRMLVPGLQPIEISQLQLTQETLPLDVFAIPKDSMEFETCDKMEFPKAIHRPDPQFSEKARHGEGTVGFSVIITKEGKVGPIRLIRPVGHGLDDVARDAISKWTFKPGSCEGHPVNVEMYVEMDFHLN